MTWASYKHGVSLFSTPSGTSGTQVNNNFKAIADYLDSVALAAATDVSGAAAAVQAASLQKSANLSDLVSASSARTNLGLGSAALSSTSAFDAAGAAAAVLGSSLQKASNLSDVANTATARTNLGLGNAATQDVVAAVSTDYTARSNGSITAADTGQTITTWGTTPPTIVNGQLVCANFQTSPTAGYATTDCGSAPSEWRSRFVLQPQGSLSNTTGGVAAHLVSQTLMNSLGQIATTDFLHVLILADSFLVQFHDGSNNTYTTFNLSETNTPGGGEYFTTRLPDDGVSVNEVVVRKTAEGGGKLYVYLPDGSYREYGGTANATQAGYIARAWGRYVTQEPFGVTVGDTEARFLALAAMTTAPPVAFDRAYANPIGTGRARQRTGLLTRKTISFTPGLTLAFTGSPTGGTFTMSVTSGGTTQTTAAVTYSTTAATLCANLQAALQALSNVGAGNATVSGTTNGGPYTVFFSPSLDGVQVTVNGAGLTGGSSPSCSCSFNGGWYRVIQTKGGAFQLSGLLRIKSNPVYAKAFYANSRATSDLLWFSYTNSNLGCEINQLGHPARGDTVVSQVRMSDDGTPGVAYLDINTVAVGSSISTPITLELIYGDGISFLPNPIAAPTVGANQVTTLTLATGIATTGTMTAAGFAGSGTALTGVMKTANNLSDVASAATARRNLGLIASQLRWLGLQAKDNNPWSNNRPYMRALKPWQPSTAYRLSAMVVNGGNRYVNYATSGTTAASGGPTQTTTNNVTTDGTCQWMYFGPNVVTSDPQSVQTTWAASTAYSLGNQVVNGTKVYACVVAGTSAGSGGPTTTGNAITDGSVTWTYMGPVYTSPYAGNWPVYTFGGTSLAASTTTLNNIHLPGSGSAMSAKRAFVVAAGSGYAVNDTINVGGSSNNGTFTTQAQLQVTSVSGGAVTGLSVKTAGAYTVLPSPTGSGPLQQASTSGSGTGCTFTVHFTNPDWYKLRGAYCAGLTFGSTNQIEVATYQAAANAQPTGGPWAIEFYSDAPSLAFYLGSNAPLGASVVIDGVRFNIDALDYPSGNPNFYIFDFSATTGRRTRHWRLEFNNPGAGNLLFYVVVDNQSSCWAPDDLDKVTAACISDSLWAGSNFGPFVLGNRVALRLGHELGWKDVWDFSTGGTGWMNPGSNLTYGTRITEALTLNPDVWVFMGSTNDSGYTSGQITAAVTAGLQAIRNGGSQAPIFVFGVWPVNTSALTVEDAVSAGVTAAADPLGRTFFIPLYRRPYMPVIQGNWNNNPAPSGLVNTNAVNANQYVNTTDAVHPVDVGSSYLGRWLADQIRQATPSLF